MSEFIPYLTFNGNCREAMLFYQRCFGGELFFQEVGDTPIAGKLPETLHRYILQATLQAEEVWLMGSDMVPDKGLQKGNGISILLNGSSRAELHRLYGELAEGGESTHPIEETSSGALFGGLTDRYGNHWLFNYLHQWP